MQSWPAGEEIEVTFIRDDQEPQRGLLATPVDYAATGFEFEQVRIPTNLSFSEPFRVETQRKWVNLATVAEIRYLPPGTVRAEFEQRAALHEQVRERLTR